MPKHTPLPINPNNTNELKHIDSAFQKIKKNNFSRISAQKEPLALYVTPKLLNIYTKSEKNDADKEIQSFLNNDEYSVFLLLGEAGTGKTLFSDYLIEQLLKYDDMLQWWVIWIPLSTQDTQKNLIMQYFQLHDITQEKIELLMKHIKILFVFEGYDESKNYENLFVTNELKNWPFAKTLITCRSDWYYYQSIEKTVTYFSPYDNKTPIPNQLMTMELLPFDSKKIENFIVKFTDERLKRNKTKKSSLFKEQSISEETVSYFSGKISSNEEIHFSKSSLKRDNKTYCNGVSFEEIIDVLLSLSDNKEAREFLSEEIAEAVLSASVICENKNDEEKKIIEYYQTFKSSLEEIGFNSLKESVRKKWLHGIYSENDTNSTLYKKYNELYNESKNSIKKICSTKEIFKNYVNIIKDGTNFRLNTLLLFSNHISSQLRIYVWKLLNNNKLELITKAGSSLAREQHVLVVPNSTYFWQLLPKKRQFISEIKKRTQWTAKDILNCLEQLPAIKKLAENPLLLSMIADVLPEISDLCGLSNTNKQATINVLDVKQWTQEKLYQVFTKYWFEHQLKRLNKKLGETSFCSAKTIEDLEKWHFQLAQEMYQNNQNFIEIKLETQSSQRVNSKQRYQKTTSEWQEKYFSDEEMYSLWLLKPMQSETGDDTIKKYTFFHDSIRIFYTQEYIYKSLTTKMSFLLDSPLNSKLLFRQDVNIMHSLIEQVKQSKTLQETMLAIITESKFNASVRIAATNAISILNLAGISLSGLDFSKVRIGGICPEDIGEKSNKKIFYGADLRSSKLDGSNFFRADCRGVNFTNASMINTDFSNGYFENSTFSEKLNLSLPEDIAIQGMCCSQWKTKDNNSVDLLAISDIKGYIYLFNSDTWQHVDTIKNWSYGQLSIVWTSSMQFSPNPKHKILVSLTIAGLVGFWEIKNNSIRFVREFKAPNGKYWDNLKINANGEWLAFSQSGSLSALKLLKEFYEVADYQKEKIDNDDQGIVIIDAKTGCSVFEEKKASCVTFHPTNSEIFTCGYENKDIIIWRLVNKKAESLAKLSGHTGSIFYLQYSPSGMQLVSSSLQGNTYLWVLEEIFNKKVKRAELQTRHGTTNLTNGILPRWYHSSMETREYVGSTYFAMRNPGLRPIRFSADGRFIFAVEDTRIIVWTSQGEKLGSIMTSSIAPISELTFTTSNYLISAASSRLSSLGFQKILTAKDVPYDIRHLNQILELVRPDSGISDGNYCCAFNSDGTLFLTGDSVGVIRLFNSSTGKCISKFSAHTERVLSLAFHPKENYFVSTAGDQKSYLWNLDGTKFEIPLCQQLTLFSNLEKKIKNINTSGAHPSALLTFSQFSPSGKWLVLGNGLHTFVIDIFENPFVNLFQNESYLSNNYRQHSIDKPQHWEDEVNYRLYKESGDYAFWEIDVNCMIDTPDGKLRYWHVSKLSDVGKDAFKNALHYGLITFTPDEKYIINSHRYIDRHKIYFWSIDPDISKPRPHKILNLRYSITKKWVEYSIATFDSTGRYYAWGGIEKVITIWDVTMPSKYPIIELIGHHSPICVLAFYPDAKKNILASGSEDGSVWLWNWRTKQRIKILQGVEDSFKQCFIPKPTLLKFSPDGQWLLCNDYKDVRRQWKIDFIHNNKDIQIKVSLYSTTDPTLRVENAKLLLVSGLFAKQQKSLQNGGSLISNRDNKSSEDVIADLARVEQQKAFRTESFFSIKKSPIFKLSEKVWVFSRFLVKSSLGLKERFFGHSLLLVEGINQYRNYVAYKIELHCRDDESKVNFFGNQKIPFSGNAQISLKQLTQEELIRIRDKYNIEETKFVDYDEIKKFLEKILTDSAKKIGYQMLAVNTTLDGASQSFNCDVWSKEQYNLIKELEEKNTEKSDCILS